MNICSYVILFLVLHCKGMRKKKEKCNNLQNTYSHASYTLLGQSHVIPQR